MVKLYSCKRSFFLLLDKNFAARTASYSICMWKYLCVYICVNTCSKWFGLFSTWARSYGRVVHLMGQFCYCCLSEYALTLCFQCLLTWLLLVCVYATVKFCPFCSCFSFLGCYVEINSCITAAVLVLLVVITVDGSEEFH